MILEQIQDMLMEFGDFTREQLTADAGFADLGLDSLDVVDLIMKIDEKFGTSIQMDGSIKTVGELVAYIESQSK